MTTHLVSHSEISTFRQCPHKWDLGYRQRWTTPERSPALAKGILWHQVLESHYKRLAEFKGRSLTERRIKLLTRSVVPYLHSEGGEQTDIQVLVEWMYGGYIDHYGLDPDWEIVAVEHEAEMFFPGSTTLKFKIKIDLIVKIKGRLWLVDHKSGRDLPSDKELTLDDQFGLYTWGMRRLGHPVYGCIYNAARTQRNVGAQSLESRHTRIMLHRTDAELDTIIRESYLTANRAFEPGDKERYPNPDTCKWKCEFLEPCLAGRKLGDKREREFLRDIGFIQDFTRH